MRDLVTNFTSAYELAKNKIKLKLWTIEYAKGWLSCYLNMVLDLSDDDYNEYANMIDDLG